MKNWKRHMSFLLAAVTASAVMSFPALAKTKYVTSISLKVHTDLETGDSIDDGESISTENGSGEGTYEMCIRDSCHPVIAYPSLLK